MNIASVKISPVNMEDRKKLGIRAGDTIRVWQKIKEKDKTRLQAFEGLVLAAKHGSEPGSTFTVRRVASGVGMEKIFPLYSPMIDKIEIIKRSKVRRSKLYYIREKAAKEIKRQMRHITMVNLSTSTQKDDSEEVENQAKDTTTVEGEETSEQTKENGVEKENKSETNGEVDAEASKKE